MATKTKTYNEGNISDFPFESLDFETLSGISTSIITILEQRKDEEEKKFIQDTMEKAESLGLNLDFSSLQKQANPKTKTGRKPIGPAKNKYWIESKSGHRIEFTGRGRVRADVQEILTELGLTIEELKADPKYLIDQG